MKLKLYKGKGKVCEAFGMTPQTFDLIMDALHDYFHAAADKIDRPEFMSDIFIEFLSSPTFESLGVPIKSVNDYFMLGFCFSMMIDHVRAEGLAHVLRAIGGAGTRENELPRGKRVD